MEASEAATGADSAAGQTEGQEEGQDAPQFDLSPLEQRMEQMAQQFGEQLQGLEQRLPTPEDPAEQQLQTDFQDLYDPATGEPDPAQAEAVLNQMIEQKASASIAPIAQELQALRVERDAERLEQQYPDLRDADNARQALDAAEERAAQIGQPELARAPGFVELVYLAEQARDRAVQETPAGASGVNLEAGGGAAPPAEDDDPAQRIVDSGRPRNMWTGG